MNTEPGMFRRGDQNHLSDQGLPKAQYRVVVRSTCRQFPNLGSSSSACRHRRGDGHRFLPRMPARYSGCGFFSLRLDADFGLSGIRANADILITNTKKIDLPVTDTIYRHGGPSHGRACGARSRGSEAKSSAIHLYATFCHNLAGRSRVVTLRQSPSSGAQEPGRKIWSHLRPNTE